MSYREAKYGVSMHRAFVAGIAAFCCAAVFAAEPSRVERRKPLTANVGVVSVGLDTYWKQCPGLYDDMLRKAAVFEERIAAHSTSRRRSPSFDP